MPLPKRKKGEKHDAFIDRCMADATMLKEFPNSAQRRAVCEKQLAGAQKTEVVLTAGSDNGEITVDAEKGVIVNAAILTAGMAFPALGEPFEIDETMLQQAADSINAAPRGVKSRISHPELAGGAYVAGGDSIFHLVGRCRNARVENGQVRGDVHLARYADDSPRGKLRTYLLGIAAEDPGAIGISIRYLSADYVQRENAAPLGRIAAVTAVDFVGTPAANPNGLLSGGEEAAAMNDDTTPPQPGAGKQTPGRKPGGVEENPMKLNAQQRAYLVSLGMAEDAGEKATAEFAKGLKPEQTTYLNEIQQPAPTPPATPPTPATAPPTPATALSIADAAGVGSEVRLALAADRERRKGIAELAKSEGLDEAAARQWADDGVTLADARRLAELARKMVGVPTGRVEGGTDRNVTTLADGIVDGLLLRVGAPLLTFDPVTGQAARDAEGRLIARKPADRALTMRRMPVAEMARQYLGAMGVGGGVGRGADLMSLSGEDVINIASCRRAEFPRKLRDAGGSVELAMSTGDFPYLLADALGKVFLGGYNLAPSTWQLWCRRMTARDFKDVKLLNLSEAPALTARYEGKEITFGSLTESRETVALVEYVAGLAFTRRMQINDDLGVFRDGGALSLGAMARYKEDDVVYAILTANATMSDGGALFNTTAVTTTGGHANLSSGSSPAVYAAAAPGLCPTVVALFLESEQAPVLKQEVQWDTDDLRVAVRHSVAAKAADWRGLYSDVSGNVTVSSLAAIVEAMVRQTGPNGAYLNLRPAFLLCPAGAKEVAFAQLVGSSVDPAKSNAVPNPFFNKLTVIGEPRLPNS